MYGRRLRLARHWHFETHCMHFLGNGGRLPTVSSRRAHRVRRRELPSRGAGLCAWSAGSAVGLGGRHQCVLPESTPTHSRRGALSGGVNGSKLARQCPRIPASVYIARGILQSAPRRIATLCCASRTLHELLSSLLRAFRRIFGDQGDLPPCGRNGQNATEPRDFYTKMKIHPEYMVIPHTGGTLFTRRKRGRTSWHTCIVAGSGHVSSALLLYVICMLHVRRVR